MAQTGSTNDTANGELAHYDAIVVGGGFSGCYLLYRLRQEGFSTHVFESGSSLGGVWHWNVYPGCRVDVEAPFYQLSIPELWRTWHWTQRFPSQPEIVAYFEHVDKTLGLSRDVTYNTSVIGADFDQQQARWIVQTSTGKSVICKYLIPAVGTHSKPIIPDLPGLGSFKGTAVHPAQWPASGIDLAGKNVAIIGTGSTGVQLTQAVAKTAGRLSVYIRTPSTAFPLCQREIDTAETASQKMMYGLLFKMTKETTFSMPWDQPTLPASAYSPTELEAYLEELWQRGGCGPAFANFTDTVTDMDTNRMFYDFWARKTRQRITDSALADFVVPREPLFPFATKRPTLEEDYYEVLQQDNVEVVNARKTPIQKLTGAGIVTDGIERTHDIIIFATGYDTFTGCHTSMGVRGKDGVELKTRWKDGISSHLGFMVPGNPNLFFVGGPNTPNGLVNTPLFAEIQTDFVIDLLKRLQNEGISSIEPKGAAAEAWKGIVQAISDGSVFKYCPSDVHSSYLGDNVPGKAHEQHAFLAGVPHYMELCRDAVKDWSNFEVVTDVTGTSA